MIESMSAWLQGLEPWQELALGLVGGAALVGVLLGAFGIARWIERRWDDVLREWLK